nr:TonB-dependent receptor [uncultured Flavobacterium sp.]
MTKTNLFFFVLLFSSFISFAQVKDTLTVKELSPVKIESASTRNSISQLEPIVGTYLFLGKKTEVISISQIDANTTEKIGRQIFAKVPGVFVYDMEGGNQINISARGLDPHRGWEFNLRKDEVLINSDMYGYPASHYSIPMESVERINLVRGTGSLQYGAQFGGMLNYISKQGDLTKPISFESYNTVGSYNLLSTYNAIGGKIDKFKYYAYFSKRSRDGYRDNEHTDYDAQGVALTYEPTEKLSFRLDYARSNYTYQLPGPLTDAMFHEDPTQATRSRNYFNPTINIPSLTIKWDVAKYTKLQFISSAVIGIRNSVLFDKVATIKDIIDPNTLQYNNRQVDVDHFNSYTQELRLLQQYKLGKQISSVVTGVQLMNNNMHRTQLGKGTTGTDFDLTLVDPAWGRDMHFKTNNVALFAENNFVLLQNLSVNLGARIEIGKSDMTGLIVYYPENEIPVTIKHSFPLLGANFSYKPTGFSDIYGGISQTYRPMLFKDLVPSSTYEKIDSNLQDSEGYNAELGFRGKYKFVQWDITGFLLQYNNRFGSLALTNPDGSFYTYKTNIGNSLTKGIELFLQGNWSLNNKSQITIFTSSSLMDGSYTSGNIKSGTSNIDIKGNRIESVPNVISRNGVTYQFLKLSVTAQFSYTAESYADALNTEIPTATGAVGLVPSYAIFDLFADYKISKNLELKASINNVTDEQYFTKRPMFYPGPGVWPSDGRNASFSVIIRL